MNHQRTQLLEQFFSSLRAVFSEARQTIHRPFHELKLSQAQLVALFIISHSKNGISVTTLAEQLHITPGAASQLVDALVQAEVAERIPSSTDRRIITVQLCTKNRAKLSSFKRHFAAELAPLFENLSNDELAQLVCLLQKVGATTQKEWSENHV